MVDKNFQRMKGNLKRDEETFESEFSVEGGEIDSVWKS